MTLGDYLLDLKMQIVLGTKGEMKYFSNKI